MKRIFALLLALTLSLSLAACGAKSAGSEAMSAMDSESSYAMTADDAGEDTNEGGWDAQTVSGTDESLAARGVKMIYSANIELQTLEFERAAEDIAALVERAGGYFEQKDFSTSSNGYRYASYTVRVPAGQFTDFCAQVGTLCHVTWQSDKAQNISEQYYDTQSRLETAQIKLERLQELLKKAESMEDIITIESAISETEYEIEELSGTVRRYDALVDYATVTLDLREVYRLSGTEDAPKTFGDKLGNAFADGLSAAGQAVEGLALWLAYHWLGVLVFALAAFAGVKLAVRARRGEGLIRQKKKEKPEE
jgi:HAMP domain-containing protein